MRRMMSLLMGGASILLPSHAFAQDFAPAEEGAGAEIIVTARRVEERLQDVPISITVFDQQKLTRENISSAKDLATYTPSLSANSRFGSDYASFSIRGFTQEARTTASVGVYFADVVAPRASVTSNSGDGAGPGQLFDLQNVQVLKGPQGTLFGRNTTGGAVLLVPQRPKAEFGGYVEGSYGSYDMRRIQAVLNVPLSDSVRVRGGIDWQRRDGWLRNHSGVGPTDFNNIDYFTGRLSLIADLSPNLENYTIATYSKSTPNGSLPKLTDCYGGVNSLTCQQLASEASLPWNSVSNWIPWANQSLKAFQVINTTTLAATDNLTIKNIMSYSKLTHRQAVDLFGVGNPVGTTFTVGANVYPVPAQYVGNYIGGSSTLSPPGMNSGNAETITEELQFVGKSQDGRLNWQAGVYYERTFSGPYAGTQSMQNVLCSNQDQWANFTCTDRSIITGASGQGGSRNYQVAQVNYNTVGLYAQGSLKLSEKITLDAGLRYTWDRTWGSARFVTVGYSASTGWNTPAFGCLNPTLTYLGTFESCTESGGVNSSAPTWVIGLNYKPSADVLLYSKYSRGYRQGAYNPLAAIGFKNYLPEKVDVYEAGVKASWRGSMPGYFNISGFYNNFRDMQLQVAFLDLNGVAPSLSPSPAIVNAGKSRIYGLEIEAMIKPLEGLTLQAGYSYLNTKLVKFTPPDLSGQPVGYYDAVSGAPTEGKRLQYTPDHKLSLSATYQLPLRPSVGRVSIGATYVYTGKIFYGETSVAARTVSVFAPGDPRFDPTINPAFSLVNFNINWEKIAGTGFDAQMFITNAFDKRYQDARSLSGSQGYIVRYYGEPRMVGGRLRYNF